jgi:methyltransferase (TIGR00027 family)
MFLKHHRDYNREDLLKECLAMLPVTTTARWAAAQRDRESQRTDRLFHDPFASALAGQVGTTALEVSERMNPRHADTAAYIAIRVKFLDDFVLRLVSQGLRQIVIPAAGMDARAFRLNLPPDTVVYEIDHPEVLGEKEEILNREDAKPRCNRITLATDLQHDWAERLKKEGFSRAEGSIWVIEGLFYYLPEKEVHSLLAQISELAAEGSGLGADIVSLSTLTSPWMQSALKTMEKSGFPWRFGTDDPEKLFVGHGWRSIARQLGEEGANFGRWKIPVVPRTETEIPRTFLVEGRRLGATMFRA